MKTFDERIETAMREATELREKDAAFAALLEEVLADVDHLRELDKRDSTICEGSCACWHRLYAKMLNRIARGDLTAAQCAELARAARGGEK